MGNHDVSSHTPNKCTLLKIQKGKLDKNTDDKFIDIQQEDDRIVDLNILRQTVDNGMKHFNILFPTKNFSINENLNYIAIDTSVYSIKNFDSKGANCYNLDGDNYDKVKSKQNEMIKEYLENKLSSYIIFSHELLVTIKCKKYNDYKDGDNAKQCGEDKEYYKLVLLNSKSDGYFIHDTNDKYDKCL
jgi:hypothetical protein